MRAFQPLRRLLAAFFLTVTIGTGASAAERQNILLIVSEDNGPELGCYGDPYVKTPVLDQLAAEGVRFENAFVAQAGCSQSRASILTGLYPHQHGQIGLATWKFGLYREDTPNLVRSLKEQGYRTGILGKLHINPESAFPFDFKELSESNFKRKNLDQYAKRAQVFMEESLTPFFLMVNYPDAHRPFLNEANGLPANPLSAADIKPLSYIGLDTPKLREATASYYNCMGRLDSSIGDLLKALEESGKLRDTVVIYLGDHGADLLRGKRTSYEGGLRVPLIVRGGGFPPHVSKKLVSTVDLMPTILDLAQVPAVKNLPGHSLRQILKEEHSSWRQYLFTEFHAHSAHDFYPQRTVRNKRYKLICTLMPEEENPGYSHTISTFFPKIASAIAAAPEPIRSAYLRMQKPPEFELYDLRNDPHEFENLAANEKYQEVFQELKSQLDQWRAETRDPLRDAEKLGRLKSEIAACFKNGSPDKDRLSLTYTDYLPEPEKKTTRTKPNVLFLAVDDMRDWVGCLGGYPGKVHTPNIDSLAGRGMLFTNAHCPSPVCAPSRAAVMTGKRPSTTGLYTNDQWWMPNLPDAVVMPDHFRNNGYRVAGAGKIFHHTAGNHPPQNWDQFSPLLFRNDPWFRGDKQNYPWSVSSPNPPGFPFSGVAKLGHENDWGSLPISDGDYDDAQTADFAIEFLNQHEGKPFFLACGLFRPHLPWYAPKEFFDQYPLDEIQLPPTKEVDLADVPPEGRRFAKAKSKDFETIRQADRWKHAVQAYLASISFADHQLGRVLDALKSSPHAENTIVVLWSDHGWHLGEKEHWHKSTLWEVGTRVPLVIQTPVGSPGVCRSPVSLIDLYPTLNALCDLPSPGPLDGVSLMPLLEDPETVWRRPAVIEYLRGNAAVRSDRMRYICYQDGSEELYDLEYDPHEWKNRADDPLFENVKQELKEWIPKNWAEPVPTKSAFTFDPENYTWTVNEKNSNVSKKSLLQN